LLHRLPHYLWLAGLLPIPLCLEKPGKRVWLELALSVWLCKGKALPIALRDGCNRNAENAGFGEPEMNPPWVVYWMTHWICRKIKSIKESKQHQTVEDIAWLMVDRWGLPIVPFKRYIWMASFCKKQDVSVGPSHRACKTRTNRLDSMVSQWSLASNVFLRVRCLIPSTISTWRNPPLRSIVALPTSRWASIIGITGRRFSSSCIKSHCNIHNGTRWNPFGCAYGEAKRLPTSHPNLLHGSTTAPRLWMMSKPNTPSSWPTISHL
jgi:hypothetical protein